MGRSKRNNRKVEAINSRLEVAKKSSAPSDSIIVPEARDRFLDIFEREQIPTSVKSSLSTASAGDMQAQYLVMLAMIDTWPRLQKGIREIKMAARKAPWKVEPYSERGEDPSEQAQNVAKEVESMLWGMKPDPARQLSSMEGTIEALIEGYFMGHQVIEPRWEAKQGKGWVPSATKVLPARFYGYPYIQNGEDKLMLDPEGRWGGQALEDFPEHRFLVAVNSGHSGHPSVGGPLRALTPYWLAAVYGLKWAMVYSQLFGIPFRWATYADDADKAQVASMMRTIGSAGWGAFKEGTQLNFEESSKGAQALPQFELMKMADEQCDIFILGQSLTSSVGDSGSRALGEVHNGVRRELIEGICDFVGEIISYQLIPAWSFWNYGEVKEDLPGFWARWQETKDEKAMAERDVALGITDGRFPVSDSWFYDRHGIPMPAEGDTIFNPAARQQGQPEPIKLDAADATLKAPKEKSDFEKLSEQVMEGLTDVAPQWLGPVRPFFDRLAALAMSKTVTDEDFMKALEDARKAIPGLFDSLDTESLEQAFEIAIGSAMLEGSTERLKTEDLNND